MLMRVQRLPVAASTFDSLFNMEQEIDGLFGNILGTTWVPAARTYPAIDMAEYENETVVVAEMPGVKKEDVKISVHDGTLHISGERKEQDLPEKSSRIRNEIRVGRFDRAIPLPHAVNVDQVSAELDNGVLRIVLPKAEEARAREIRVR